MCSNPGPKQKPSPTGPSIRKYVVETARENGIDRHIRFGHHVDAADWSSETATWTVRSSRKGEEEAVITCSFLFMCSGYYNYAGGYTPDFEGISDFSGQVVHPQFWPEELDYAGKTRGRDRLGRHGGDHRAGDGQERRPRHHAAAFADLCGLAPGGGRPGQLAARETARPSSPTRSCVGAMCLGECISSTWRGSARRG